MVEPELAKLPVSYRSDEKGTSLGACSIWFTSYFSPRFLQQSSEMATLSKEMVWSFRTEAPEEMFKACDYGYELASV